MASLSVLDPESTPTTSAPNSRMRETLGAWRAMSTCPHVHAARQAQLRRGGGRRDAVLPRAGLGDDPRLAHPLCQQHLAERVVQLVGAGVQEVFALQDDPRASRLRREIPGEGKRRGPSRVGPEQLRELGLEPPVPAESRKGLFELLERRHQRLGREPAAVLAEIPLAPRSGQWLAASLLRTASKKRAMRSAVLDSRRALDARGDVDRGGMHPSDRLAHVVGRQPAGQEERQREAEPFEPPPVERLARAAPAARRAGIEEERPAALEQLGRGHGEARRARAGHRDDGTRHRAAGHRGEARDGAGRGRAAPPRTPARSSS